jgi:hypothetical protein
MAQRVTRGFTRNLACNLSRNLTCNLMCLAAVAALLALTVIPGLADFVAEVGLEGASSLRRSLS